MATHVFTPVLGKRIRVTRLDVCGRVPDPAEADAFVVTNGFITVNLTAEVEDGTEIITKRADGSMCVNERTANSFKNFTAEVEFCGVDPALLTIMTNADPYEDWAGDLAGFTVAEGAIDKAFAFELWTGLSGQACAEGATDAGGYLLLPFVQAGVLGDLEVGSENAVSFSLTGAFTKGGNAWGVGPYDVVMDPTTPPAVAAPLPSALDPLDHLLLIDTALAPPPSAPGQLQAMPV